MCRRSVGILTLRVLSDRGGQFIGNFNQALAKRLKISDSEDLTTAYKPSTDGQIERVSKVLEQMLQYYVSPTINNWDKCLSKAQLAISNIVYWLLGLGLSLASP